ncbi:MAG: DeoR family transcriptional regulator [Actinobacteria bacterium]|nr:DeoR family transcriptional regulator [Actinomycetota bacterium]
MSTSNKIIDYISKNGQASGKELTDHLGNISGRGVRKQLKNLTEKNILQKIGKPPKVYYSLATNKETVKTIRVNSFPLA